MTYNLSVDNKRPTR